MEPFLMLESLALRPEERPRAAADCMRVI